MLGRGTVGEGCRGVMGEGVRRGKGYDGEGYNVRSVLCCRDME